MKKLATFLLATGILMGTGTTAMAAEPVINYDGTARNMQYPVIVQEGRTLLAVRDMTALLGQEIEWNPKTRIATITVDDKVIQFQPDLQRLIVNNTVQSIDVGPQIFNDRIYLPFRYLFEVTGNEVRYISQPDGTGVINITSKESRKVYLKTDGNKTIALRDFDNPDQVILTRDNILKEVKVENNNLLIHKTSEKQHATVCDTEKFIVQQKVTHIMDLDGKYYAIFDQEQLPNHIGTGISPTGGALTDRIITPLGDFRFYPGGGIVDAYDLEGNEGYVKKTLEGHMLSIVDSNHTFVDKDYAFGPNVYGFLTDGQFLLIGKTDPIGYRALACHQISDTLQQGKLFYNPEDTFFYAIGVDKAEDADVQALHVIAYTSQGMKTLSDSVIKGLAANSITILDTCRQGNMAYLLVKADDATYLARCNMTTHQMTPELLTEPYTAFASAAGTTQLYYAGDDYYHFYAFMQ